MRRRFPIGAEVVPGGAHVRVWAPRMERVGVEVDGRVTPLEREDDGHFSGLVRGARDGTRYRLAIDGEPSRIADPFSRWQPDGPHGASIVIDPTRYEWCDRGWRGRSIRDAVIYELHVGTFTREGTWRAAAERLASLAELGVTVIEVMPIADFPGDFGWGYDGVCLFAPYHGYGTPDDLRAFVDRAHAVGLSVILDVVYNHLGPDGNYLSVLAPDCFTERYETDWGVPLDFDGPRCAPVRAIVAANARAWIEEYHLDGLRLDATQNVYDYSRGEHVLAEVVRHAREAAAGRELVVIGENECQDTRLVRDYGIDAVWNDDLHHSAVVALTGRSEAYYSDHTGTARELLAAAKHGYLFQGQRYAWQRQRRGTPALDLPPHAFVAFLENHDQVANTLDGTRLHALTSPARHRALSALVLLGPGTPMLFQGAEVLSRAPFLYFADQRALSEAIRKGRGEFLRQFPSLASDAAQAALPDPGARETFARCAIEWREDDEAARHRAFVRALLRTRREDGVLAGRARTRIDGAALDDDTLALRLFGADGDDRLIVVHLGRSRVLTSWAEPLIAPPLGMRWRTALSSEDVSWGGRGAVELEQEDGLHLTAESTTLLVPEPDPDHARRFAPPVPRRNDR